MENSIQLKKASDDIIQRRMLYAAGLGLIPIPIIDAASILGTQVLMIRDIASLYGIPFKEKQVRNFITVLAGNLGTIGVIKAIPGLGTVLGGAALSFSGVAATYAIGKIFVQHFNQGGTILDFDPVKSRKYFQKLYEEGEVQAEQLQGNNTNKDRENSIMASKEKELKAKQKKALTAARRKKAIRRKRWRRIGLLSFFLAVIIVGSYYLRYQFSDDTVPENKIDWAELEKSGVKINLIPIENLDSAITAKIAAFTLFSTEGVIHSYINNPEATYPKRFQLSAVSFKGSSVVLNPGAEKQLTNISLIMEKYPDLIVNLYGHTTIIGPKFNRQRIGRERARSISNALVKKGVSINRITSHFIEKTASVNNEYWGAEIVIDVFRVE